MYVCFKRLISAINPCRLLDLGKRLGLDTVSIVRRFPKQSLLPRPQSDRGLCTELYLVHPIRLQALPEVGMYVLLQGSRPINGCDG